MPEASVDEDCHSILGKDQIGLARKVATMQAETHPASVKEAADNHLGPCVTSTNGSHDSATSLPIKNVSHDFPVYDSASVAQSRGAHLDRLPRTTTGVVAALRVISTFYLGQSDDDS